ncbi:MAG: hypothetical protein ABEK10_03625 [Candidatus Nanosalina sp.]
MAEEYGIYPDAIGSIDTLKDKLMNVYGFGEEVDEIVNVLREIYIAQEGSDFIGYPHNEAEIKHDENHLDTLRRLRVIKEHQYTGKHEYGYDCTEIGNRLGSEAINILLEEKRDEIRETLSKYSTSMLAFLFKFGFGKTDTGHFSTRSAKLRTGEFVDKGIFSTEKIQDEYRQLRKDLKDLDIAVQHEDGSQKAPGRTVLPPEFQGFIKDIDADLQPALKKMEQYRIMRDYIQGTIETREELLEELEENTEGDIEQKINELHEKGLVSEYRERNPPFLVKDKDKLLKNLQREVENELGDVGES